MIIDIVKGISVPFLGTTLGAFCVFFLKNELSKGMQKALTGFAAGVMVAASIWSLLLPALEQGASLGMWKFLPAVIGFWIGILFLMAIDYFAPPECIDEKCKNKLLLAVTLHNIPEGISISVPIYYSKKSKKNAFLYTMISGLSEPLGALLSMIFLYKYISNFLIAILFSLIAGLMSYISIFELMKTSFKYDKNKIYILYGSFFILIVEILLKI